MVFPCEFWIKLSFFFCSFTVGNSLTFPLLLPSSTHDNIRGGGRRNSANRVGDIRLHFQGVERIELPQFPHLRRAEARNQCDQRCLSEPLIPSIRHASSPPLPLYSFSHLYTLKRSRAHFFFNAQLHFFPYFFHAGCALLWLTRSVIPRRACYDVPRAFSDIQHVSDVLFAHR